MRNRESSRTHRPDTRRDRREQRLGIGQTELSIVGFIAPETVAFPPGRFLISSAIRGRRSEVDGPPPPSPLPPDYRVRSCDVRKSRPRVRGSGLGYRTPPATFGDLLPARTMLARPDKPDGRTVILADTCRKPFRARGASPVRNLFLPVDHFGGFSRSCACRMRKIHIHIRGRQKITIFVVWIGRVRFVSNKTVTRKPARMSRALASPRRSNSRSIFPISVISVSSPPLPTPSSSFPFFFPLPRRLADRSIKLIRFERDEAGEGRGEGDGEGEGERGRLHTKSRANDCSSVGENSFAKLAGV